MKEWLWPKVTFKKSSIATIQHRKSGMPEIQVRRCQGSNYFEPMITSYPGIQTFMIIKQNKQFDILLGLPFY